MDKRRSLTAAHVKTVRHGGKPYGLDSATTSTALILRVIPTGGNQWIEDGTIHCKRLDLGSM